MPSHSKAKGVNPLSPRGLGRGGALQPTPEMVNSEEIRGSHAPSKVSNAATSHPSQLISSLPELNPVPSSPILRRRCGRTRHLKQLAVFQPDSS